MQRASEFHSNLRCYEADAYAAEYLGHLDAETGSWCVEALLQQQEDDLRITEYENATLSFCMSGCVTDCRPAKMEAGEPLRRAVERRYLVLGGDRLLCFDVNARTSWEASAIMTAPATSWYQWWSWRRGFKKWQPWRGGTGCAISCEPRATVC